MKNLKFILLSLFALAFVTSCDKVDEQTTQTLAGSTVTFTGDISSNYLGDDIEGVIVTVVFDENCETADINLNNLSLNGLELNVDFYDVSCTSTAIYQTGVISATFMGMDYQSEVSFSDFDFTVSGSNLSGSFVLTAANYGLNAETFSFSTTSTTIVKPQEEDFYSDYNETYFIGFEGQFSDYEETFTCASSTLRVGLDTLNKLAVLTYSNVKFSANMNAIEFSTKPLSYTEEDNWVRIEHGNLEEFYPIISGKEYTSQTIDFIELVFDDKGLYYDSSIDISGSTYLFSSERDADFTTFNVIGNFVCSEYTNYDITLTVSPSGDNFCADFKFSGVKLYEGMDAVDITLPGMYYIYSDEGFEVSGEYTGIEPIVSNSEETWPMLYNVEIFFIQGLVDGFKFEIGDTEDFCCSFVTFN